MRIVYFYAKDGKKIGPLSKEQLDDLHLAPDTLVWHYGLTGWIPYKNLPKQVVKEDEESPFDKFCAWLKSKKKEVDSKTEIKSAAITEIPAEAEMKDSLEEPIVNSPNPQKPKPEKKWVKYTIAGFLLIIIMLISIWANGKYNVYKAEKQKQEQIRELVQKGEEATEQSLLELASKYYNDAIELDSMSWALYYLKGNNLFRQDNFSSACNYYEKAYELNPNHSDTVITSDTLHYGHMLCKYALAMQNAHPCWARTMELSQEYYSLYSYKAIAYRIMVFAYFTYAHEIKYDNQTKDEYIDKALQWARKMVAQFPDESDSYFCLAYIQSERHDTYDAIENYKKSIQLKPWAIAYNNLGCCYEKLNNYQEAYKYWRKAVELGDDKYARNNLKRYGQYVE